MMAIAPPEGLHSLTPHEGCWGGQDASVTWTCSGWLLQHVSNPLMATISLEISTLNFAATGFENQLEPLARVTWFRNDGDPQLWPKNEISMSSWRSSVVIAS